MVKMRLVSILLLTIWGVSGDARSVTDGRSVTGFDVFFPQVAQGVSGGLSIETVLTFSNPYNEGVNICLQSFGIDLQGIQQFRVNAHHTREIVFRGGPLQVGWVRVIAERVVGASARLTTRPAPESNEVLTTITILGQPLTSLAAIPVLRNLPEADNTGIAIAYFQDGTLRFTLFDERGQTVASREERRGFTPGGALSDQTAFLISDLFPNLGDFQSGTLVIEHVEPERIAEAFAATALYLRQGQFGAAEVTGVDDVREYVILPNSMSNIAELAAELETIYGFELEQTFASTIVGLMTGETARAVARDSRVQDVQPSAAGPF